MKEFELAGSGSGKVEKDGSASKSEFDLHRIQAVLKQIFIASDLVENPNRPMVHTNILDELPTFYKKF